MNWWPWRDKREDAAPAPSQDAVVAALLQTQAASLPVGATAALETAAGLYARALALAEVSPSTPATRLLTPAVLAAMGRGLIVNGESVHILAADLDGAYLQQVGAWEVLGRSPRPSSWRYRCDIPTPSATLTRVVPEGELVHPKYSVRPGTPWKGLSPVGGNAPLSQNLAGKLEQSLVKEMSLPTGMMVFTAGGARTFDDGDNPLTDDEGYATILDDLADSARSTKPGLMLGNSRRAVDNMDASTIDPFDLPNAPPTHERFGPRPPAEVHDLRSDVADSILAACGVPPAMVRASSAGSARESLRQWLHGGVAFVAAILLEELRRKLGEPRLEFGFDGLHAADVTGRARAYGTLTKAGMDAGRAASIAGLA